MLPMTYLLTGLTIQTTKGSALRLSHGFGL